MSQQPRQQVKRVDRGLAGWAAASAAGLGSHSPPGLAGGWGRQEPASQVREALERSRRAGVSVGSGSLSTGRPALWAWLLAQGHKVGSVP